MVGTWVLRLVLVLRMFLWIMLSRVWNLCIVMIGIVICLVALCCRATCFSVWVWIIVLRSLVIGLLVLVR